MKTTLSLLLVLILGGLLSVRPAVAQQTTAFTYQGQLRDGGTNAVGTYAMTFRLYDAVSGGGQIGSTVNDNPTLANGLFTVNLDFGGGAFNGNARWLEISVAGDTLTPRVQVLPAPYALYAAVAATVTNGAIMNAQLAVSAIATTNIQNNAVTTAQIADGAVTNRNLAANAVNATNIASGQVVKSLNGLGDVLTLEAGANVSIFTNGNALQMSAGVPSIQAFLSSGTFVVPTNVTKIMVEIWGGGGGGGLDGGTDTNGVSYPGGGGGSGGYAFSILSVIPGTSYTVATGNGGAGSTVPCLNLGCSGENGGTSSFGILLSAGGGSGGLGGSGGNGFDPAGSGGAKGTGSGGLFNVGGGNGLPGGQPTPGFGGWGGSAWRGPAAGNGGDGPAVGGRGGSMNNPARSGHPGLVLIYY